MFINNLTLMLVNLVAGLVLMAHFIYVGLGRPDQKPWIPGFAMTGFVAVSTGMHMIWQWPLPGSFNIAYGEMSVLFGIIFLGAALALGLGARLLTVGIYAAFAGLAAVVVGLRVISLGMSQQPLLAGIGFILAGAGGPLLLACQHFISNRALRLTATIVLLMAALIFAITGYVAYWGHLANYSAWAPAAP